MNRRLLPLYSLAYNPFTPGAPVDAFRETPQIQSFCQRIEYQLAEGGFSLITGDPGTGKSVTLRILVKQMQQLPDVAVGVLTRPQASVTDFYREMGDLFGVKLTAYNRWGGTKALRQRWLEHIDSNHYRPLLIIDEAQAASTVVLGELRLLSSADLDSCTLLTTVLSGDERLLVKLQSDEMRPLLSRIRTRIQCDLASPEELKDSLYNLLEHAGNRNLFPNNLVNTLCEHAAGNYRTLMNMADDLLKTAMRDEIRQIDEKLFFDTFFQQQKPNRKRGER